jgi:hypothetical protein
MKRSNHWVAGLMLVAVNLPLESAQASDLEAPRSTMRASASIDRSERAALAAVHGEVLRQVSALAAERARTTAGPSRQAIDLRIVQLKRQGWIRELEMRAEFARQRGDEALAARCERLLEQVRRPFVPPAVAPPQSIDKVPTTEGGRR